MGGGWHAHSSSRLEVRFCPNCQIESVHKGRMCVRCRQSEPRPSKFGNVPVRSKHSGRMIQSKLEADREGWLVAAFRAGKITELRPDPDIRTDRQQSFDLDVYSTPLVESLLRAIEEGDDIETRRIAKLLPRSRIRICRYRADFTYKDDLGRLVVEDVKSPGTRTPVYRLKKLLMLATQDIEIQEPKVR